MISFFRLNQVYLFELDFSINVIFNFIFFIKINFCNYVCIIIIIIEQKEVIVIHRIVILIIDYYDLIVVEIGVVTDDGNVNLLVEEIFDFVVIVVVVSSDVIQDLQNFDFGKEKKRHPNVQVYDLLKIHAKVLELHKNFIYVVILLIVKNLVEKIVNEVAIRPVVVSNENLVVEQIVLYVLKEIVEKINVANFVTMVYLNLGFD